MELPANICLRSPNGRHCWSVPVNGSQECLFCGKVALTIVPRTTDNTRATDHGGGG